MEISLDGLLTGRYGIVTSVDVNAGLKGRLASFGFVEGTQVGCRYRSPGGSVTALEFRSTVLALRTRDLQNILVRC